MPATYKGPRGWLGYFILGPERPFKKLWWRLRYAYWMWRTSRGVLSIPFCFGSASACVNSLMPEQENPKDAAIEEVELMFSGE